METNIFEIKDEFKATIVGFNGSGLPLGERNDLDKLAEMAQYNPALANMFVKCPTGEVLTAWKENKMLAATEPEPKIVTLDPPVTLVEEEKEE